MRYFILSLFLLLFNHIFGQVNCNKWLSTPTINAAVNVGDLDISGNQITVEATINRNQPYNPGIGNNNEGDVVSKHTDQNDVNYLIRPNHAYVTTTNGFFGTPDVCAIELNKTYHIAMVYNGATLKFYRNGFLMSQVNASGNLFQNNLNTRIGYYDLQVFTTQFLGYINEVRIWNVARSQTELQTYMNSSLPNPTTQVGLKGYYTFDNLLNKQGNTAFNGTLNGSATINATNPNCNFVADSCNVLIPQEVIINDYTSVLSLDPCKNILNVSNATAYNVGDTVLLIQMKGAVVNGTNNSAFGTITDYKSAGNYEYNFVKSKTGNQIELKNNILRTYEIPNGKVQLIRVPYYQNYSTTGTLTCLPWNGTIGGVLVFNVANTLTLNNDVDVSGKGFLGGGVGVGFNCNSSNWANNTEGGIKGESISNFIPNFNKGGAKQANGGGGSFSANTGGGGGGNYGQGGLGGKEFSGCSNPIQSQAGVALNYTVANKLFLGGGGGGAEQDNGFTIYPGGNGGGIIMLQSNSIIANGKKIISNGESVSQTIRDEGGSGGGGGGTILISNNTYTGNINIEAKGGDGTSNNNVTYANDCHGPGAGGGGGLLAISNATIPANLIYSAIGGKAGKVLNPASPCFNTTYGATNGFIGGTLFNQNLIVSTIPFKPNIDSVKINAVNTTCFAFNFNGLGYTNSNPISTWQWYFGDNTTASGQNVSHNYTTTNTFTVKLIVTDINGCKDSITRNVTTNSVVVDAGIDKIFCGPKTGIQLTGTSASAGSSTYAWTSIPATTITNANSLTPIVDATTTTTFYCTVTSSLGCIGVDSVKVIINPIPIVQTLNDISICKGTSLQLTTTLGLNTYQWSTGIYVSDSTIANPIFNDTIPRMLIVTGSNGLCSAKDTINISIKPLPIVKTIKDTLICSTQNIVLTTTGASTYSWTPPTYLSSTNTSNPTYIGTGSSSTSTTYYVTGTAANGCSAKDTITVNKNALNSFVDPPNKSFCKNESVQLNGNNGNTVTYFWQPSTDINNQTIIDPIVNPNSTTNYTVNITDPVCNYSKLFTVVVTENPLPIVTVTKSNDITCNNISAKLDASGALIYTWNNTTTLSNATAPNPIANPITTTEYTVIGTDINGCKNNSTIKVFVSTFTNLFEMPNTFTPNGDSKNDCFGVVNWGNAQFVYFIIYNRWGEKVFETNNINKCWDGKYKGEQAGMGNYVYYISAKTSCGDVVKKGNVLLMR